MSECERVTRRSGPNRYEHVCLRCDYRSEGTRPRLAMDCLAPQNPVFDARCVHLGAATGARFDCGGCRSGRPPIRACAIFGECLELTVKEGIDCCPHCERYEV